LPVSVCLITLVSSEEWSQFERFRLQPVQMVKKTSRYKAKLSNNAEASRVNNSSRQHNSGYRLLLGHIRTESLAPSL